MASSRKRTANCRYSDQEYALVRFTEDGVYEICKAEELSTVDGNLSAPYHGSHYPATIIQKSDDKNALLKIKGVLGKPSKSKHKPKKTKNDNKKKKESNNGSNEKAKAKEVRTSRVEGLLQKMTSEDRFDMDIVEAMSDLLGDGDDDIQVLSGSTPQQRQPLNSVPMTNGRSLTTSLHSPATTHTSTAPHHQPHASSQKNKNVNKNKKKKQGNNKNEAEKENSKEVRVSRVEALLQKMTTESDGNAEIHILADRTPRESNCEDLSFNTPATQHSLPLARTASLPTPSGRSLTPSYHSSLTTNTPTTPRCRPHASSNTNHIPVPPSFRNESAWEDNLYGDYVDDNVPEDTHSHHIQRPIQRPPPQKPTSGIKRPMPRQPARPTTGGKCPRMRVLVQEDPECSRCEELQLENELLKQQLDEIINNKDFCSVAGKRNIVDITDPDDACQLVRKHYTLLKSFVEEKILFEQYQVDVIGTCYFPFIVHVAPRPGKVHPLIAAKYQMVLLSPGSGVYLYPDGLAEAKKKSTGTACAARLLNAFYTNEELKGKNLKKSDKINGLDETVVESIVAYTARHFTLSAYGIRCGLRMKLQNLMPAEMRQKNRQ